jgi:hypothetical protein
LRGEPAGHESGGRVVLFKGRVARLLLKGLYKFAFKTARGDGCGVMFATEDGKLYGGNSGSSFIGTAALPGVVFESVLTPINDIDPRRAPAVRRPRSRYRIFRNL